MSFLFKVRAGRVLWIAWGVAAMLCVAEVPAAAQEFFSSPGDKQSPRPLPWQERGLRAALADASPVLRSLAVEHISYKRWVGLFLTADERCQAFSKGKTPTLLIFNLMKDRCLGC